MPINLPNNLPAIDTLEKENIFVMVTDRASRQQIRPLEIIVLNLMPTKVTTETQLARLLGNTPLQVNLTLLRLKSHESTHVSENHMNHFYRTLDDIRERNFDGLIITGAPIETIPFEEVDYWDELCEIMDWSVTHVQSTMHICWGAQAALYHHYGIPKVLLDEKLFGVFPHYVSHLHSILFRGFDDTFMVPHSRHTGIRKEDVLKVKELKILAESERAGVYAISTDGGRQLFITGHSEYDPDTLEKEYLRDKNAGLPIHVPENYYPDDDDTKRPRCTWRSSANMLFSNWLNYFVYQITPFELEHLRDNVIDARENPTRYANS